jgi:hypothetical protein
MITDKDVNDILQSIFSSQDTAGAGRTNYLRTLIVATQEELGHKKGEPVTTQLGAVKRVHERFYDLVLKAAAPFVPKGTKDRAVELHRRANFARTSLSAVRGHIRAGEDIVTLSAAKATKGALARKERPPKSMSAKQWRARIGGQAQGLIAALTGLAGTDKAAAVAEVQRALGQLTAHLGSLGVLSTKDATQSHAEMRPLRIGKTLFVPAPLLMLRHHAASGADGHN